MPYFVKKTADGWDTVKDNGDVLGSHKTKKDAVAQMVAVSLAEKIPPGGEMRATFTPPADVQATAKRALDWIEQGLAGSGFTAVGRTRASQLANGEPVSEATIGRMASYFARHAVDKDATGFNSGEEGYPTPGRVAWDAWGGDAGLSWVNSLGSKMTTRDAGTPIGISDIDDTLIVNGQLHSDYYGWLDHQQVDLYLVTGRLESDRESTVAQLNKLGVEYSALIMNTGEDSNVFKGETASNLMADGYDILFAVDNNPQARAAYEAAGVVNVYDPKKMPAMASEATRDADMPEPVAVETVEVTREYLASELKELLGNVVSLKFLAHGAHWNVKGVLFHQFHEFFGDIYSDYDDMIDPLSENIRKLDFESPFTLPQYVADTEIEATFVGGDPVDLSVAIYKANEIVKGDVVDAMECADELNEQGIYNFLADLQDRLSKWHWQLGAVIGPEKTAAFFVDPEEVGEVHVPEIIEPNTPSTDVAEVEGRGKASEIETRTLTMPIEVREDGNGMTFRGYAALFNSPSEPLPFIEKIAPGAFKRSLQSRNEVKLLWNHDTGTVLGSLRAGTLSLTEDDKGLLVEAQLPDTQAGRDAAVLLKRGDVSAMSFGFRVPAGGDSWSSDGQERTLNSVRLHEVSIVAFPAYEGTQGMTSVRNEEAETVAGDVTNTRKKLLDLHAKL